MKTTAATGATDKEGEEGNMPKITILVGPSGCGKSAVAEELIARHKYMKIITCTTRQPRAKEINGMDYYFLSKEKFAEKKAANEMITCTEYAGNSYGTDKSEIGAALRSGKNIIMILDIRGALEIRGSYPDDAILVFIDRNKDDIIKSINKRRMPEAEKARRIEQIDVDMKNKNICDIIMPNQEIASVADAIARINNYERSVAT